VTNQPNRKNSKSTGKILYEYIKIYSVRLDPLAKIRPIISKRPNLAQQLSRSNTIQISPGLK